MDDDMSRMDDMEGYLSHYMSFRKQIKPTDVKIARDSLETAGMIADGKWVFGDGNGAATYSFLARASKHLQDSARAESTGGLGPPTHQLVDFPNKPIRSSKARSTYKIDACLVSLTDGVAPEKPTHAQMAVTAEYTMNVSDRPQVIHNFSLHVPLSFPIELEAAAQRRHLHQECGPSAQAHV